QQVQNELPRLNVAAKPFVPGLRRASTAPSKAQKQAPVEQPSPVLVLDRRPAPEDCGNADAEIACPNGHAADVEIAHEDTEVVQSSRQPLSRTHHQPSLSEESRLSTPWLSLRLSRSAQRTAVPIPKTLDFSNPALPATRVLVAMPLFSFPAQTAVVLTSSEVVEIYAGDRCAPEISGTVLRYPPDFLKRFSSQCAAPPSLRNTLKDTGLLGHTRPDLAGPCSNNSSHLRRTKTSVALNSPSGPLDFGLWRSSSSSSANPSPRRRHETRAPSRPEAVVSAVKPLEKSTGRYIPKVLQAGATADETSEEVYDRRIRALLNKLTPDNFGVVSEKLLVLGQRPAAPSGEHPMRRLVALIFAKVTDENVWAKVYTQLCVKLIQETGDEVKDEGLSQVAGGSLRGGRLVRTYLLNQCQEEFDRGWAADIPLNIESSEYYEASTVKRRGLGLMEFVGELFLVDVATANIVHACLSGLLASTGDAVPEVAKAESAARLLSVAGSKLESMSGKARVSQYVARIQDMINDKRLPQRVRFGLMDIIDLHRENWVPRVKSVGPTTIAEFHEAIQRSQAEAESQRSRRGSDNSRFGSRGSSSGRVGDVKPGASNELAGDLSRFGNLSRSKRLAAGAMPSGNPFGALTGGLRGWQSTSASNQPVNQRPATQRHTNQWPGSHGSQSRTMNRTVSQPSLGAGPRAGAPMSITPSNTFDALADRSGDRESVRKAAATPETRAALGRRVKAIVGEFLQLGSMSELVACLCELEQDGHQVAACEMANIIVDCRQDQVETIVAAAAHLRSKLVLNEDAVVVGLAEYGAQLEDVALDAPDAYSRFGLLMASAGIPIVRVPEVLRCLDASAPAAAVARAYLERLVAVDGHEKTKAAVAGAGLHAPQLLGRVEDLEPAAREALGMSGLLDLLSC
ncbi:hypothetical protein LPJ61_004721, partial [Coemansia biformis]